MKSHTTAIAFRVGKTDNWAASIQLRKKDHELNGNEPTPLAIHFVIDNSGSMGTLTKQVKEVFSTLVDSAATRPCSLTLFSNRATVLSSNVTTSEQMFQSKTLPQGATNIPAGVEEAINIITKTEQKEISMKFSEEQKTHHILVLLTDGHHNTGQEPRIRFPKISSKIKSTIPNVQLSVVVVGITKNSSTSMGMLLKSCLETVPMDTDLLQNIYFAASATAMKTVTKGMIIGLNQFSSGIMHTISSSYDSLKLIAEIGEDPTETIKIRMTPRASDINILLQSKDPPKHILVDAEEIEFIIQDEALIDYSLVATILMKHIDKGRIKRVALGTEAFFSSKALRQLSTMIDVLANCISSQKGNSQLLLQRASGKDRLNQHRDVVKSIHVARELRNQLSDVINFSANSSEEQAAFLTGNHGKYASKAIRRAANRRNKMSDEDNAILDPEKEQDRICGQLTKPSFGNALRRALWEDTIKHLLQLSEDQRQKLHDHVRATNKDDLYLLERVMKWSLKDLPIRDNKENKDISNYQASNFLVNKIKTKKNIWDEIAPDICKFVDSGTLFVYINDVFFGGRVSYLSQMNSWEHISEWVNLSNGTGNANFKSLWEMLLYVGLIGYPIVIQRNNSSQMNPFQLVVKKVHTSVVDTASLSCANHSEIACYGPEGGEPIEDVLVLVDPSLPTSSNQIARTALLGDIFTSVVVSRDLHMYTGPSMKVALLANSLFRCLQPDSGMKNKSDIIASIQREFRNSYQCPSCGYGPIDHGGCSDLLAHHGEVDDMTGGVVSNACPNCGFLSFDLSDWEKWDGRVPENLLSTKLENNTSKSGFSEPLSTNMDMVLRILYSFRKIFSRPGDTIRTWYNNLAQKMVDWDLNFTTQDEVDGVTQILLAIMVCDDDVINKKDGDDGVMEVEAAFAPPVILSIINEACARYARKKLMMATGGDEPKAKKQAVDTVTEMLCISKESAPTTMESLLEPEPSRADVEASCSRDYKISTRSKENMEWVSNISTKWCRVLSLARCLRVSIIKRGGGWKKLEQDMETSTDNYIDVIKSLQNNPHESFLSLCDVSEASLDRTVATMAAQAMLYTKGSERQNLPDVRYNETISNIARDMRMNIYESCVSDKMAQWKNEGEELVFLKACACNTEQYMNMLSYHVHGLDKERFWALWEAAIVGDNDDNGNRVRAFLETANDSFRHKYGPSSLDKKEGSTKPCGRKKSKNHLINIEKEKANE